MTNRPALEVRNLTKSFEGDPPFVAVDNLSFAIPYGQVVGILGPNGAGKTTLIQMLLSTLTPTRGNIEFFGMDAKKYRSQVLGHIGFASAYINFSGHLTVFENLYIFALLYGLHSKQATAAVKKNLDAFRMSEFSHRQVMTLSAGQKTRVMLAKAFLMDPKLVLLDEPTASLDPDIAEEVCNFIVEQQCARGVTVLVTSHDMDEVAHMCNRVLVMQRGKLIADDTPSALASSIDTAKIHLQITQGMQELEHLCAQQQMPLQKTGSHVTVAVAEQKIAQFLAMCSKKNIIYTYITIDKPTLEDYFLKIARSSFDTSLAGHSG